MKQLILGVSFICTFFMQASAQTAVQPATLDLSSVGIKAVITLPAGLTAEVSKDMGDIKVKFSDGSVMLFFNTFGKKEPALMLKEFKEEAKTTYDKVEYMKEDAVSVVYKAEQMGSTLYGMCGYKMIGATVYMVSQEVTRGLTEAQCNAMLEVFKSIKPVK